MNSNVLIALTLIAFGAVAHSARAQSNGLLALRSGMASDEALHLMAGHYEVSDTVNSLDGTPILRLAPVPGVT